MIGFCARLEPILLKNPVDLFFFAPDDVPIIAISFPPLSVVESLIDAVPERCFEFDILAGCGREYGGLG